MTNSKNFSLTFLITLIALSLTSYLGLGLLKVSKAVSPITPPTTPPTTPTPITPPYINRSPVIFTKFLPPGVSYKKYSATIEGYDLDREDKLTMTIRSLPYGLSQKSCRNFLRAGRNYIQCQIGGIPNRPGKYQITVSLSDQRTTVESKLTLRIIL